MKRSAALSQWSQEHHAALVLARRIANAGDEDARAALLASVPTTFDRELEPHFRAEEAVLLPRLEAAGQIDLVRRTAQDHLLLRELAARIASGDRAALQPFGRLLKEHVRFEERELFAAAESVLPAEFLAGHAHPAQRVSDESEPPSR